MADEPLALALAPPWGRGDLLETKLGLVVMLGLGAGLTEPGGLQSLPPLQAFLPRGAGMRFQLDLDLQALGTHLSGILANQPLQVEGYRIRIGHVDLKGEGSELVLTALFTGDAAGRIEIRARPVFDPAAQRIRLEELDFVLDLQDPDQNLNELLTARTDGLRDALESALSRSVPEDLKLDPSSLRLAELGLTLVGSALCLRGIATGSLAVTVR